MNSHQIPHLYSLHLWGGGEVPESGDEKLQKSKVKGKQDLFAKGKSAPGKKK